MHSVTQVISFVEAHKDEIRDEGFFTLLARSLRLILTLHMANKSATASLRYTALGTASSEA